MISRIGPMVLVPVAFVLTGCLEWPFSAPGNGRAGEAAQLLAVPGVEGNLHRLKSEFEQLRPSHKPLRSDDPNIALFAEVLGRVVSEHVRVVEPNALIDGAIKGLRKGVEGEIKEPVTDRLLIEAAITGMMSTLDPYSSYLNPESYRNMQAQTHGEFGGLGIEVTMDQKTGYIKVVAPIDGTPAARAGLRSGDLISDVDGVSVKGMTLIQAVFRMRGPTGTSVRLTIRRNEAGPTEIVSLTRSIVKLHPIQARSEGDVGYVRITTFNERTASELEEAVTKLKQAREPKLSGLVIDLRNDPGGLLDQAIAVADDFIDSGLIVSVRGRRSTEGRSYEAGGDGLIAGLPVVILINSGSASASEIVAAALQDHHRALVFGTRSYGKGSVQTVSPLPDGGALRLTTARYYRPNGTSVDCVGVSPDLEIKSPAKAGRTEESHQDPATCAGLNQPPPQAPSLRMADLCPDVKESVNVIEPAVAERDGKEAKEPPDLPLKCALAAITTKRVIGRR